MIKETIERFKILAEGFLKDNIRVAIIDIENSFYFADILFVGDDRLTIQCFAPEKKSGQKFYLDWASIIKLNRYEEREWKKI